MFVGRADFNAWLVDLTVFHIIVAEGVHRLFGGRTAGSQETFDSRNQMTRNEHQFEIKRSRYVLNGRKSRVDFGALEI